MILKFVIQVKSFDSELKKKLVKKKSIQYRTQPWAKSSTESQSDVGKEDFDKTKGWPVWNERVKCFQGPSESSNMSRAHGPSFNVATLTGFFLSCEHFKPGLALNRF